MEVVCFKHLCKIDTVDGGILEFFENKYYEISITKTGKVNIDGYIFSLDEFHRNFITLVDLREQRINKFLKCIL